jgi:hypothetical protein
MRLKLFAATPVLAAAGVAMGLLVAPPAAANVDPCRTPVSTSRCLGPVGIDNFQVPSSNPGAGFGNGPYGPWGGIPPLGR